MYKKMCFTCGGNYNKDFVDKPCPECGRQYNIMNVDSLVKATEFTEISNKVTDMIIPKNYQGVVWSKELLLKYNSELKSDMNFMKYVEQLGKIHSIFQKGLVPSKSAIIVGSPATSKVTWAYSCMQYAIKNNYTVAPLLSTTEATRLFRLSGDNPKYKLYNMFEFDEYVMSDVLFLTVSKTEARFTSYSIIMELIDTRSRKGLPTFIISRYDRLQMSKWGGVDEFKYIKDERGTENDLKYPAYLAYWETSQARDFNNEENRE